MGGLFRFGRRGLLGLDGDEGCVGRVCERLGGCLYVDRLEDRIGGDTKLCFRWWLRIGVVLVFVFGEGVIGVVKGML